LAQVCDKFNILPTDPRIREMTVWQLSEIVYHERDQYGPIKTSDREPLTDDERFKRRWREWGLTEEQIDHKINEMFELDAYRDSLEKGEKRTPAEIEKMVRDYERKMIERRTWGLF